VGPLVGACSTRIDADRASKSMAPIAAAAAPVLSAPAWAAATTMAHPPVRHPPGVADVVVHVPIAPGESRRATIDHGDVRLMDGALADAYRIDLGRGQRVTIEARGGPSFTEPCCSLDVVLRVAQGARTLVEDDDSAGGFDAQIQLVAPEAGTYLVRVSTYGAGERRGPYELRVF
jgi:hypothetical protein